MTHLNDNPLLDWINGTPAKKKRRIANLQVKQSKENKIVDRRRTLEVAVKPFGLLGPDMAGPPP
jgi:hypothetical protein